MQGRLLPLSAGMPAWNMSVDQAILESVDGGAMPTLRFYGWLEPTLSLGYFQKYDSRAEHPASQPCQYVRRATGGGAILHHHELTYSIVMPMSVSETKARQRLYRQVHQAFVTALADFGIRANPYRLDGRVAGSEFTFLCFQRRTDEDLIVSGYKVLGSAQRRTRGAVLQHGSLLVESSVFAPELPGLVDLTSKSLDSGELVDRISGKLCERLGVQWESGQLADQERQRARHVESDQFATERWNRRR